MIVRLHSQYESVGETATLYLSGSLRPGEEDVLHRMLVALPDHIRMVRVDLGALRQADQTAVDIVRQVLLRCRAERGGSYHLAVGPAPVISETSVARPPADVAGAAPLYARARPRRPVDIPADAVQGPSLAAR